MCGRKTEDRSQKTRGVFNFTASPIALSPHRPIAISPPKSAEKPLPSFS